MCLGGGNSRHKSVASLLLRIQKEDSNSTPADAVGHPEYSRCRPVQLTASRKKSMIYLDRVPELLRIAHGHPESRKLGLLFSLNKIYTYLIVLLLSLYISHHQTN